MVADEVAEAVEAVAEEVTVVVATADPAPTLTAVAVAVATVVVTAAVTAVVAVAGKQLAAVVRSWGTFVQRLSFTSTVLLQVRVCVYVSFVYSHYTCFGVQRRL